MPFQIIRNDITKVKADAIVNTANPDPIIGGGMDAAIYYAAGKRRLLAERKKIGKIAPGEVVSTRAFKLDAAYILHTVGPVWIDGCQGELEILHSCYKKSLELASDLSCNSIAFPLIATGTYGFPKDEALKIALAEINHFLLEHDMLVYLVVFDRKAFELSGKLVGEIEEYINEHEVRELRLAEYSAASYSGGNYSNHEARRREAIRRRREKQAEQVLEEAASYPMADMPMGAPKKETRKETESIAGSFPNFTEKSLDELLRTKEKTFQERLLELIDESGMDDVTVYKKANIDRKVFSKIRCNTDYRPQKKTAVAFAIALKLDLPTMQDLLSRAGIAFSPSNRFDLIISYFVTHGIYDIFEINAALFKYGQPILG